MKTRTRMTVICAVIGAACVAYGARYDTALVSWITGDTRNDVAEPSLDTFLPLDETTLPIKEEPGPVLAGQINEYGIWRKCLVRNSQTPIFDQPGGTPQTSTLGLFEILFIHGEDQRDDVTWYRVGHSEQADSVLGYVSGNDVALWDTRIGAELIEVSPAYADPEAWTERLNQGFTSCQQLARAYPGSGQAPWPVAERRTIRLADGRECQIVKVHFLGILKNGQSAEASSRSKLDALREAVMQITVVYVLDSTLSTVPSIEAVQLALDSLTRQMAGSGDLQLQLVRYTDRDPGYALAKDEQGNDSPVQVVFDDWTDVEGFIQRSSTLEPLTIEHSYGQEEAAFDGLQMAMDRPWSPRGVNLLIWIADAPGHEPGCQKNPMNIKLSDLVDRANEQYVNVVSLELAHYYCDACLQHDVDDEAFRPCRECREIRERIEEQMQTLSAATDGQTFRLKCDENLVDDIAAKIVEQIGQAKQRAQARIEALDRAIGGQSAEAIVQTSDPQNRADLGRFFEILDATGIDVSELGPGEPVYGNGWMLVGDDGAQYLRTKVLLGRTELNFLNDELMNLKLLCEEGKGLDVAFRMRVEPRSFVHVKQDGNTPFDVHMKKAGIPLCTGILTKTRAEWESMSNDEREQLRNYLLQKISGLAEKLTSDEYFAQGEREYIWIDETLLP